MSQFALPLAVRASGPSRVIVGSANAHVVEALSASEHWPFHTAVLTGPPRSGKSLLARWFTGRGLGDVVDDAFSMDETALFHHWNRTQETGVPLLLIGGVPPWRISLPDLQSRLGAALQLEIGLPDDAMAGDLLLSLAEERGLPLGEDAVGYLIPRTGRSQADLERLVAMIDRLSLERKQPATQSIWRAALEAVHGPQEPRLL
ncbi:ATPase [Altererythrobacter xixiisoli]|uniref:ATPase n=1 Tax=Croceibacterium xixiisoli TaxID=1476466 RepID=A0A6I4TR79_9SPHN|nr:ATPase [Croceibacterium xixiisoli]MXO98436.1 ATPase [Croceibacterium xixiisoli]